MGRPAINLTGQIFGRLTVLERDTAKPSGQGKSAYWICQCECGNRVSIRSDKLKKGIAQSCGCLKERLNKILQDNQINYKTQYTFSDLQGETGSLLRFDFAILNKEQDLLGLIKYQGEQHYKLMGYDTEERFQKRQNYDIQKAAYCKAHNIPLLTIPFTDYAQLNYDYLDNSFFSLYGGGTK